MDSSSPLPIDSKRTFVADWSTKRTLKRDAPKKSSYWHGEYPKQDPNWDLRGPTGWVDQMISNNIPQSWKDSAKNILWNTAANMLKGKGPVASAVASEMTARRRTTRRDEL